MFHFCCSELVADGDNISTAGKKKASKKKAKGKLTLAEKLLVKLEKGVDLLKASKNKYEHFVQIADTWLIQHGAKVKGRFIKMANNTDGVATYDELKSGMVHLRLLEMYCTSR